jgi:outer membrane protein assembly factor BamD (BamD/ComL family)
MKRFLLPLLALSAALSIVACVTAVKIPEGLSPAELIQRAQEARDRNRYGIAMQYYQTLLERNINNLDLVCESEYEIAFIHYKQKKYTPAKEGFFALLKRYNSSDREFLPPKFEILANKVLDSISKKEIRRNPLAARKAKKDSEKQEAP